MLETDTGGGSQGLHNVEELEQVYELQVRFQSSSHLRATFANLNLGCVKPLPSTLDILNLGYVVNPG